jgi:hypothetical protein
MIGWTTRLMIKEAIAIVTALPLPNRSPRIAGPMNGTAGADAVSAANTLSLNGKRNMKRNIKNTRAYKPTIAAKIATTSAISWTSSARGVPTVPTKSASGTAYNNTMRLRTDASFGPKSRRQAATKPRSRVKTIGASALRMVCTMAGEIPLAWRTVRRSLASRVYAGSVAGHGGTQRHGNCRLIYFASARGLSPAN